jgi:hypothetical protein
MPLETVPEKKALHIWMAIKSNPHQVIDFTFLKISPLPQAN